MQKLGRLFALCILALSFLSPRPGSCESGDPSSPSPESRPVSKKLVNAGDPLSDEFPSGPNVGESVPDFTLIDQFGNAVNFTEKRGPNRALILFYRSASW